MNAGPAGRPQGGAARPRRRGMSRIVGDLPRSRRKPSTAGPAARPVPSLGEPSASKGSARRAAPIRSANSPCIPYRRPRPARSGSCRRSAARAPAPSAAPGRAVRRRSRVHADAVVLDPERAVAVPAFEGDAHRAAPAAGEGVLEGVDHAPEERRDEPGRRAARPPALRRGGARRPAAGPRRARPLERGLVLRPAGAAAATASPRRACPRTC